jgi:hypothetical protein
MIDPASYFFPLFCAAPVDPAISRAPVREGPVATPLQREDLNES